ILSLLQLPTTPLFYTLSLHDALPIYFRIEEDVYLNEDLFRLKFPLAPGETESPPVVTISLMDPSNGRLRWNCTVCESLCEHVGRSEEHTSELQSRGQLVCRLLLEKKK